MMKKNKLSREELCDILANSDGYLKRILAVIGASPDEQEEIAHQAIFNAYEKTDSLFHSFKIYYLLKQPLTSAFRLIFY